jgi:hypothetical protein
LSHLDSQATLPRGTVVLRLSETAVCAWIALERQILGISLSKPSFKVNPKGMNDLKGAFAYDFGKIVW